MCEKRPIYVEKIPIYARGKRREQAVQSECGGVKRNLYMWKESYVCVKETYVLKRPIKRPTKRHSTCSVQQTCEKRPTCLKNMYKRDVYGLVCSKCEKMTYKRDSYVSKDPYTCEKRPIYVQNVYKRDLHSVVCSKCVKMNC